MAVMTHVQSDQTAVVAEGRRRAMQALHEAKAMLDASQVTDHGAFDRIVAEHHAPIRRLVFRLLAWRDGAEDIVQEVFLSAWAAWLKVQRIENPELWLKRIAINKCRSRMRREAVRSRWLRWFLYRCLDKPLYEHADSIATGERAQRVREAVSSLAPSYREVAVLHYLEQMDIREIADLIGARRNTVEVRLHRARRQLERLLADLTE
jgi:RNA polymerase sigma-70 factor (ECF subfamily)